MRIYTMGNIYESLDKGVYEYTNAILDISFWTYEGFRFP